MFYQEKGSAGPGLMQYITDESTRIEVVTGLYKYTEYEFEILAFTSVGDGLKSSILTERTKEDGKTCRIFILLPKYSVNFLPYGAFFLFIILIEQLVLRKHRRLVRIMILW